VSGVSSSYKQLELGNILCYVIVSVLLSRSLFSSTQIDSDIP